MHLRNTSNRYGAVSVLLHWLVALLVFGLFGLGYWMMDLDYYDPWRQTAPFIHKSVGILLLMLMVFRLLWRIATPNPAVLPTHTPATRLLARIGHGALYVGLFVLMIAGYLISTADGRAIEVFGLFSVPALISGLPNQEDIAGKVHEYLAWALVIFALMHGLAALKHHFIDRDATLLRMLGRTKK